jgi:uncharacterized protein YutE (UPF0331/DUF86 family)
MKLRELPTSTKLAELRDRVERVRARCPATAEELRSDLDALDLVSFNLMLAVQSCSDCACDLIADEGWRVVTSLPGAFDRLREEGVISTTTAVALGRAVGLRNAVMHGHARENPTMVHTAATQGLGDLEAFAREVERWISARTPD